MNKKRRSHLWMGGILLLGAFVVAPGSRATFAQEHHEEGGHDDAGGATAAKAELDDYSDAVAAIDKHRAHVEELIEHEKLSELHKAAKPIQLIAEKLVGLALKEDSGVPRQSLKEVNVTSKALAKTWAKIDEAGDAGDLAGSKKVYQEIVDLINTLKKFARPVEEEHHEDAHGEEGHEEQGEEERGH